VRAPGRTDLGGAKNR